MKATRNNDYEAQETLELKCKEFKGTSEYDGDEDIEHDAEVTYTKKMDIGVSMKRKFVEEEETTQESKKMKHGKNDDETKMVEGTEN